MVQWYSSDIAVDENTMENSPFQYDLSDLFNSEDIFAPQLPEVEIAKYMEQINEQLDKPADDSIGGLDSDYTLLDYLEAGGSGEQEHEVGHEEFQCEEEIEKQEETEKQKEKQTVDMQEEIQVEIEYEGQSETVTIIRMDENNNTKKAEHDESEVKEVAKKRKTDKKIKELEISPKKRGRRTREFELKVEKAVEMSDKFELVGRKVKELLDNDQEVSREILDNLVKEIMHK